MYRRLFIFFSFIILIISAQAQKWEPGRFTDVKGNIEIGLIRTKPSGKAPIKDEAFIEFKEDNKAEPFKLSASDLKSFVVGKDSFVVAHAPQNETWAKNELEFVKVVLDEPVKLYAAKVGSGSGHGFGFSPGISTGIGTGGYGGGIGGGFGGGISIPIGGRGGSEKTVWYFGENTAEMKRLNNDNFEDIMSDIMGDEPDVVDKIHNKEYVLGNIDKLIAYFKQVASAHKNP
ncbi:MAG: hypothetical protein M3N14_12335 [Bacteroidota bacterium]|nr:hypothetical protein [Bacteroidota bacterium]